MFTNVLEYLESSAENFPTKTAIYESNGEKIIFKALKDKAMQVGTFIADKGIINSSIAVVASQSKETLIMYFGVLYSRKHYVPLLSSLILPVKISFYTFQAMGYL